VEELREYIRDYTFQIVREPSVTGDECHCNIHGIKDKDSKQFCKDYCKPPDIYLCIEQDCKELDEDSYSNLAELGLGS
jgi:hypothetical protein